MFFSSLFLRIWLIFFNAIAAAYFFFVHLFLMFTMWNKPNIVPPSETEKPESPHGQLPAGCRTLQWLD
jgi:hypothetical protein